jgi:hypothetical protein
MMSLTEGKGETKNSLKSSEYTYLLCKHKKGKFEID